MTMPATDQSGDQLPDALAAWIGSVLGAPCGRIEEVIGGGSRQSAIVTTTAGTRAFLRRETGRGPLADTPFTLRREYAVIRFLQDSEVPVARCHAYSAEHDAILMEVVGGFTTYERTLPESEQAVLRRQLMKAIVALQDIDPAAVPELASPPGATLRDVISVDLATWEGLYRDRVTTPDPLIEFALGWLAHAIPDAAERPVIVHGDIGPGNFIVDESRIAALIDWEMVRVGHPLEDVACIIARGLGAPFGAPREHVANYEAISGTAIDPAALDQALVLVLVRWNIAISIGLSRPTAAQNVPMLLAFRQINARALIAAIRRCEGMAGPDRTDPSPDPGGHTAVRPVLAYGAALIDDLAGSGAIAPGDRYRLAGFGGLLTYLAGYIAYGPERYEGEDRERIGRLLSEPPADSRSAIAALCVQVRSTSAADVRRFASFFNWRVEREHGIMRGFLGDRADNHIELDRNGGKPC